MLGDALPPDRRGSSLTINPSSLYAVRGAGASGFARAGDESGLLGNAELSGDAALGTNGHGPHASLGHFPRIN